MTLRKKLGFTVCVVLIFVGIAAGLAAAQDEGMHLSAHSFVIMDARTGRILLSYRPHLLWPPASTLKVMTAMDVVEHLKLDDKVHVSRYAASAPPSKIGLKPGQTYTVQELLYALLLPSANDAARALAERVCGSEATFAHDLTHEVRQWGAYRTTCRTANGLPADNQYSTAEDLAKMFRRAMKFPELVKIMSTKYYTIPGHRKFRNLNRFLWTTPLAVGGKTGYTRAAQHNFVGMFKKGNHEIIVVSLGSPKKYMWSDLRELIEKGFQLEGAPIAKLPAAEERLFFVKRSHHKARRHRRVRRKRHSRVVKGSVACIPHKRAKLKRKSGNGD
jgi:serine-type D-Ala-D-Ala carboxypeptidase (penicillin-binding protein 5/6)